MTNLAFPNIDSTTLMQRLTPPVEDEINLLDTFKQLVQLAQEHFGADSCMISARHPITRKLFHTFVCSDEHKLAPEAFSERTFDAMLTTLTQQSVLLNEQSEGIGDYCESVRRTFQTSAALPLHIQPNATPSGILFLSFEQERAFSENDGAILQQFAHHASEILQEIWQLHRYNEVARIGLDINQDISDFFALFDKLRLLVTDILDIQHALMLSIYHSTSNTCEIYIVDEGHYQHFPICPVHGACGHAMQQKKHIIVQNLQQEQADLPFQILPIPDTTPKQAFIFVPLLLRDGAVGTLSIQHPEPNAYSIEDLALLKVLANHAALAVSNIQLYGSLAQLNKVGQFLTRQLAGIEKLPQTIEQIQEVTRADVVLLCTVSSGKQHNASLTSISSPHASTELVSRLDTWLKSQVHREPLSIGNLAQAEEGQIPAEIAALLLEERLSALAILPLAVEQEIVGNLCILFKYPQLFKSSRRLLLENLAHFAANAIKNGQTLDSALSRRVRELRVLQQIDKELNRNLEPEPMLKAVLKIAGEYIHAERAAVSLRNFMTRQPEIHTVWGMPDMPPFGMTHNEQEAAPAAETSLTGWVMKHNKALRIDNMQEEDSWNDGDLDLDATMVARLAVPMTTDEGTIGVLSFASSRAEAFDQEDEAFLGTLAGQVVLAVTRARIYEREQRLAREQQELYIISQEIARQLDPHRIFELILDKALSLMQAQAGVLMEHEEKKGMLHMVAQRGVLPDKQWQDHSIDKGIVGYVARTKEPLNIDPHQMQWSEHYLSYIPDTCSELAVPLLADGKVRGVLNIESTREHAFTNDDVHLLQRLADMAVLALRNADLYDAAQREHSRLERLLTTSSRLSEIHEPEQYVQAYHYVIEHLRHEHKTSSVAVRRYDETTEQLVLEQAASDSRPFEHTLPVDQGINAYVASSGATFDSATVTYLSADIDRSQVPADLPSLIVAPIQFNGRYYGTLSLGHSEKEYFGDMDRHVVEGLAEQLATMIYRIEETKARRASEQVTDIGQSAMELTHRLGGDLGLVNTYIGDVQSRLDAHRIRDTAIESKLEKIDAAVRKVLKFTRELQNIISNTRETEQETLISSPSTILQEVREDSMIPPNIRVEMLLPDEVYPVSVIGRSIHDLLLHLIKNAIQAMPHGGTLTLKTYNRQATIVALEVQDTGHGIPPNMTDHIFGLFYSTKGSSGFGLWSARRNAERNHGSLKIKNKPGGGTTFRLLLPSATGRPGITGPLHEEKH